MLRGLALLALAAITDGFVSRCPSSRIRASTSSSRAAFLGLDLPELHAELPAFEVPALALPVASLESIGPVPVLAAAAGVGMALLGASLSSPAAGAAGAAGAPPSPYASGRYEPASAARYFGARPLLVLARAAEIFSRSTALAALALVDWRTGQLVANARERGTQLAELLADLGPTFIKIGQALSIRADLLPAEYCLALASLQDRVPPFDDATARAILADELGEKNAAPLLRTLSPRPVASASLGQVYRASLARGGADEGVVEVAVKVQRPGVLETIALDLLLLRALSGAADALLRSETDLVGLIDEWGGAFVDELDYRREAANAAAFGESIAATPLRDVVFAPVTVNAATTSKVLVTGWVDGERLDQSDADDVARLCGVAMNTYLTMMLETGLLHADPHPGNLLRARDGRLCILDWGLVTRIPAGRQLAFVEHVAHLVSKDYAAVPQDLVELGFVPEGQQAAVGSSDVVAAIANVYGAWGMGGGAAKVDVGSVLGELLELTDTYGTLFRVPPYFFYIARAFATLEGIGLTADENYSILDECLPYVAQRVMTDGSPRAARALASFVYGPARERAPADRSFDVERLEYLADGFSSYATSAGGRARGAAENVEELERVASQLCDLVLSDDAAGTPLQAIVLEELAKALGASARDAASRARARTERALGPSALAALDPTGLGRALTRGSLIERDARDVRTIESARRATAAIEPQLRATLERLSPEETRELSSKLLAQLWARRAGASLAARKLAVMLAQQAAERLERGSRGSAHHVREAPAAAKRDLNSLRSADPEEQRKTFRTDGPDRSLAAGS